MAKPSKDELIAKARNLYLTPASDGSHAHSNVEIAKVLQSEFGATINQSTVYRWAMKLNWEAIFQAGIDAGAASAVIEAQPEATGKTTEEELKDAIARQRHEDWRMANELKRKGHAYIMAHDFDSAKDALAAFAAGMAVTKADRLEVSGPGGAPVQIEVSDAKQRLAERLARANERTDPREPG